MSRLKTLTSGLTLTFLTLKRRDLRVELIHVFAELGNDANFGSYTTTEVSLAYGRMRPIPASGCPRAHWDLIVIELFRQTTAIRDRPDRPIPR